MTELLKAFYQAQKETACRDNVSHKALVMATYGSGSIIQALIAAIASSGGLHGPVQATYDLLTNPDPPAEIDRRIAAGLQIPGWGNSFHKEGIEPVYQPVMDELRKRNELLAAKIDRITEYLHGLGILIYPNTTTFICSVGIVECIPVEVMMVLPIEGRLWAWAEEFHNIYKNMPKI